MEYTITLNKQFNSYEVAFLGKPDQETRNNLKHLKYRWNPKKCIWYGFSTEDELVAALSGGTTEENKIKPIETGGSFSEGYSGHAWDGIYAHTDFRLQDINKYLKQLCRKNYGIDIRTKYQSYSGGESTYIYIMLDENSFISTEELLNKYNSQCGPNSIHEFVNIHAFSDMNAYTSDAWIDRFNKSSEEERIEIIKNWYETKFKCSGRKTMTNYYYTELEFLKPNYKEAYKAINNTLNSFKHSDNDGMTDYFDTNFYHFIYLVFPNNNTNE